MSAGTKLPAAARFLAIAQEFPERPALEVAGEIWTYGELAAAAWQIAARLPPAQPGAPQPVTAVMAQRRASAYAGILATQLRGHAYVPLNVTQPAQRNATILAASGADRVIVGDLASDTMASILQAPELATGLARIARIDCGEHRADYDLAAPLPTAEAIAPDLPERIAYILFTSGSTGAPKGVQVPASSLEAYLYATQALLEVGPDDRFSQTFDLTFDLSVHDIFVSLTRGATLVVPSVNDLKDPASFIRTGRITHWFSVPALAHQVRLQGALRADAFPRLKSSLFCGEVLPAALAREWAAAAPAARVENWYGPTEATIACAVQPAAPEALDPAEPDVPIGRAFPGMRLRILAPDLSELPAGEPGELFLSGAQLAAGYLSDPARTAAAFVVLPDGTRAYRTGDRAVEGADGAIRFLGRTDTQIKLRGYRIELGEIEAALRDEAGGRNALAFAWPPGGSDIRGIVAAVEGDADTARLRAGLAQRLPAYMLPASIHAVPLFPRTLSGKADRKAVAEIIAVREAAPAPSAALSAPEQALLDAVLRAAPLLERDSVLTAPTLFDAGMDSLAFVALTMEIELAHGKHLDQEDVVRLSGLSFAQLAREIAAPAPRRPRRPGPVRRIWRGLLGRIRPQYNPRANRALQFIERFAAALDGGPPPVVALGSSGIFRGFAPAEFEAEMEASGWPIRALNVGLPAIDVAGLASIAEHVAATCRARGLRLPLSIWEFDPMHVSVAPPRGDIALSPRFFSGRLRARPSPALNAEFEWSADRGGSWAGGPVAIDTARRANWTRERDRLIARAYLGGLALSPRRLADWERGLSALAGVSDRVCVFVHPADRAMLAEMPDAARGPAFDEVLERIVQDHDVDLLRWEDFALDSADFIDINHVNADRGRPRLSRQLARLVRQAAEACPPASSAPQPAHDPRASLRHRHPRRLRQA